MAVIKQLIWGFGKAEFCPSCQFVAWRRANNSNWQKVEKIVSGRAFTITRPPPQEAEWPYSEIRRTIGESNGGCEPLCGAPSRPRRYHQAANAVNLLPLSAAQLTWTDFPLVRLRRERPNRTSLRTCDSVSRRHGWAWVTGLILLHNFKVVGLKCKRGSSPSTSNSQPAAQRPDRKN
jgi:hypothetical protein